MRHAMPRWTWWAVCAAVLFTAWARPGRAETVTVTWTPATTYVDGTPLPFERSWTLVAQYAAGCPADIYGPVDGVGTPVGVTRYVTTWTQPAGTCWCYIARTVVWGATAVVSAPVEVEHCVPAATCAGCHR